MSSLRLEPYDPWSELKARTAVGIARLKKEWDDVKDPGVQVSPDYESRSRANRKRWLAKKEKPDG